MEKAYQREFTGEKSGSLYVNCCGLSRTEPLHSFGPALKPHYLIHYIVSGRGRLQLGGKEYPLEQGYGFLEESKRLGISLGACYKRFERLRVKLQKILADDN